MPQTPKRAELQYITTEKVNALEIPQDIKDFINGMVAIIPRAEEVKHGTMWFRSLNMILLELYKEHRPEWAKLFMPNTKHLKPVKGVYDPLNKVSLTATKATFIAQPCESCSTKELEEYKRTGRLPERLR